MGKTGQGRRMDVDWVWVGLIVASTILVAGQVALGIVLFTVTKGT